MRSGAKSLTHFLWVLVPAAFLAARHTSFTGAGLTVVVVVYLVLKFCNSIDRSEIRAGTKPQLKGRASKR